MSQLNMRELQLHEFNSVSGGESQLDMFMQGAAMLGGGLAAAPTGVGCLVAAVGVTMMMTSLVWS